MENKGGIEMIDINELRRLAQAALAGPDGISLNWIKLLQDFQQKTSPAAISELLDRLEAAENDVALKERVIDALGSELNAVANERDALRSLVVMRFDHDHPPQFIQGYSPHELNEPVTADHCRWFVAEIERLRAKIEQMEKQEPVYLFRRKGLDDFCTCSKEKYEVFSAKPRLFEVKTLYALPGAQTQREEK